MKIICVSILIVVSMLFISFVVGANDQIDRIVQIFFENIKDKNYTNMQLLIENEYLQRDIIDFMKDVKLTDLKWRIEDKEYINKNEIKLLVYTESKNNYGKYKSTSSFKFKKNEGKWYLIDTNFINHFNKIKYNWILLLLTIFVTIPFTIHALTYLPSKKEKILWLTIIIIGNFIGALIYYFKI